jgi:hypothetical protein
MRSAMAIRKEHKAICAKLDELEREPAKNKAHTNQMAIAVMDGKPRVHHKKKITAGGAAPQRIACHCS